MATIVAQIQTLEGLLADKDNMNNEVYKFVQRGDLNNDSMISNSEFYNMMSNFGIGNREAVNGLFISLDKDGNGFISFKEFMPFFQAQTQIKLGHLKEMKALIDQAAVDQATSASSETSSKKKKGFFRRTKSSKK